MKLIIKYLICVVAVFAINNSTVQAQTCDSLAGVCKKMLKTPGKADKGSVYVSDGQTYRAFLDEDQTSEFQTTFFGGNTYRIAASAGTRENYIIFEVRDNQNNLIFSNTDHKNASYWDFKVESSLDVVISMSLDANKKSSGCAVMLIGFKQKK